MGLPVLEIFGLTKRLGRRQILKVDRLRFTGGEIYGLVGPNGAGKTTLLKCICGLLRLENGRIALDELGLCEEKRAQFLRQIGSVFAQTDSLFDLIIDELLSEHYYFFGLKKPKKWQSVLENVGLVVEGDQTIGSLSLGMRQRLLLALALSHDPAILILDEPFNGLDPDGMRLMKNRLEQLATNKIVIITGHSFNDLADVITQAVVMAEGQIGEMKSLAEIKQLHRDGLAGYYQQCVNQISAPHRFQTQEGI